jgi:hypothetical protein
MTLKPDNNVPGNAIYLYLVQTLAVHGAIPLPTGCIRGVGLNKLQEGLHFANC